MSKVDYSSIGSVAGGLIGAYVGGPAGAAAGQAIGSAAGQAIEGSPESGNAAPGSGASSVSGSSSPQSCWAPKPSCGSNSPIGLTTNGKDAIDTGRYLLTFKNGECEVYDKLTDTRFRAWGDPHLTTGDGDKAQFHEDLAIRLEDGTKIEFDVTPKNANGVALIENVSVMKGNQAVRVEGLTGNDGFKMGNVLNNAQQVDQMIQEQTTLVAGRQVDDLTFLNSGREIVGTDPNARFGEILIDGQDGPRNKPPIESQTPADGPNQPGATNGADGVGTAESTNFSGMSIQEILYAIIGKLEKTLRAKAEQLAQKTDQFNDQKAKEGDGGPAPEGGVQESALKRLQSQVQSMSQAVEQLTKLASNLLDIDGNTKKAIIENTRS